MRLQSKNSIMLEIPSESLKIPNMNKTSLTGVPDMARKLKIELKRTARFLTFLAGERRLPSTIAGENLLNFARTALEPNRIN